MKITITNSGVEGVDAITIFKRDYTAGTTENYACIEGGGSLELEWTEGDVRYEVVPWIRIPAP